MPALPRWTLKVVPAPLIEGVPTAPPALETPNPTVEGKCGKCGAVLMRGEEGKAPPLMILCVSCGYQWASDHCHTLAGSTPILALDMYEHSYQMDFGAKAASYVDTFMDVIRWNNVERLLVQAARAQGNGGVTGQ